MEEQYMSSTTEFLYSPSDLNETLEVVVAAVNTVGVGAEFSIMVDPPSAGELCIPCQLVLAIIIIVHC